MPSFILDIAINFQMSQGKSYEVFLGESWANLWQQMTEKSNNPGAWKQGVLLYTKKFMIVLYEKHTAKVYMSI
jgi:hypothetical protein